MSFNSINSWSYFIDILFIKKEIQLISKILFYQTLKYLLKQYS